MKFILKILKFLRNLRRIREIKLEFCQKLYSDKIILIDHAQFAIGAHGNLQMLMPYVIEKASACFFVKMIKVYRNGYLLIG